MFTSSQKKKYFNKQISQWGRQRKQTNGRGFYKILSMS